MAANQSLTKTAVTPKSPLSGMKLALQVLGALSESLPRQNGAQPFSPEALEFMAEGLADLPADGLKRAATRARNSCRWMPTVAELRDFAGCSEASIADAERAAEIAAWDQAQAWVRRYRERLRNITTGQLGWTDASDYLWLNAADRPTPIRPLPARVEEALRRVGGPDAIQSAWRTDAEVWLRKSFCEAYRLSAAIQDARESLQVGSGEVERLVDGLAGQLGMGSAL